LEIYRSKFSSKAFSSSIRMEESSKTVPSIVVYVTVPNREAGFVFALILNFLCF